MAAFKGLGQSRVWKAAKYGQTIRAAAPKAMEEATKITKAVAQTSEMAERISWVVLYFQL